MSTLLTRMFRERKDAPELPMHGSRPLQTPEQKRKPDPTPSSFWWAYALVLLAVAALWRAFA